MVGDSSESGHLDFGPMAASLSPVATLFEADEIVVYRPPMSSIETESVPLREGRSAWMRTADGEYIPMFDPLGIGI